MNWLDALILFPLLVGLVRGIMRGFLTEVMAIVAVIFGVVGARLWGPAVALWIQYHMTWPEPVTQVIGYGLVFLGIAILLNLIGKWFTHLLKKLSLGWLNRLIGGLFGVLKYGLIILLIVAAVSTLDDRFHFLDQNLLATSVVWPYATQLAHQLIAAL